jgi:hypothetical protein
MRGLLGVVNSLLSLDFLDNYELSLLNDGKVGRPFKITIVFLAVVRYLFSMPYRQIEGFTRSLHRLVLRLPTVDYSWARRLRLDLSPYGSLSRYDGPVAIAVDSSGVSVHKCGGWVERLYSRRKRYYTSQLTLEREVIAMDVTTDDVHGSEALRA